MKELMSDWCREISVAFRSDDQDLPNILDVFFTDTTRVQNIFAACTVAKSLNDEQRRELALRVMRDLGRLSLFDRDALRMARLCESEKMAKIALRELSLMRQNEAFAHVLLMEAYRPVADVLMRLCKVVADSQVDEV